jgi:hypothetical protein
MKGYPRGFQPVLWAVCGALAVSGLLLVPTTLAMRLGWDLPWRLPGGARIGVAAMHAAASFAMLFVFGALWSIHARAGWRRNRQRKSGALLVLGFTGLALTAIGVYYLGESGAADVTALVHLALGVALALPLGVHAVRGRRHHRHHHAGHAQAARLRRDRVSERGVRA